MNNISFPRLPFSLSTVLPGYLRINLCEGSNSNISSSRTPSVPRQGALFLPEGKRSMTGWLSTCSVALPPLRVNRTTWYLPSLTITALSSMIMSSVPTLKITPIFPRSCRQRTKRKHCEKDAEEQTKLYKCTLNKLYPDICCYPLKHHLNLNSLRK